MNSLIKMFSISFSQVVAAATLLSSSSCRQPPLSQGQNGEGVITFTRLFHLGNGHCPMYGRWFWVWVSGLSWGGLTFRCGGYPLPHSSSQYHHIFSFAWWLGSLIMQAGPPAFSSQQGNGFLGMW